MPIEAGFEATLAENHSRDKLSDTRFILGDDLIILRDLPVSGRRTNSLRQLIPLRRVIICPLYKFGHFTVIHKRKVFLECTKSAKSQNQSTLIEKRNTFSTRVWPGLRSRSWSRRPGSLGLRSWNCKESMV